ncbi:tellurite resistance TerB family protein [Streptomyces sp. DG2A-72]|uniref:tellurite resistance TerB family protein n=1 Tax=Streptomyces sp. DG2A-72 TaxID=3051386 RepID=UPI00265BCAC8|nr:tellurite resistance TerB family protein [Streptomyces sp. DG2A-72]MDO0934834.1 tellurite resistance TerB family protein [Streptomyces sp. DG2A-72]
MAMWDRIKDQAKGLQQGSRGSGGHGTPGARSGGGSKAQLVSALKTQLTSLKTELKSGAYRDASMAMCALVAAADGTVDPAERQHVESLIVSNDVLQNFPPDQLRQRFNKHVDQLAVNFQHAKAEAMQEIAKAAKKPTEARAVVQTGFVVAGADGYIAPAEEQVLREACAALGLSPRSSASDRTRSPNRRRHCPAPVVAAALRPSSR